MRTEWTLFRRLTGAALALTFVVVLLGAYVRLSDAGLGCPDWPGCYGRWIVPAQPHHLAAANAAYPQRPVEPAKAWKEMIHRYAAGLLGLLVLALAILAWRNRRDPAQPVGLPLALLVLIGFQSLLGMWTVTWQLKPVIVVAHLLGGLTTLGLLAWLLLDQRRCQTQPVSAAGRRLLRRYAGLGLALLAAQIVLGGWTSANYAALACPDFPTCQTQWWPPMDFREAFTPWRGLGVSYEGGVLANDARVTLHFMHRLGALVVTLALGGLSIRLLVAVPNRAARSLGGAIALLLMIQISLGVANVVLHLPLAVAVAHTGGAALLLLALVMLNHHLQAEGAPC